MFTECCEVTAKTEVGELVLRAQDGDSEALAQLFLEFHDTIVNVANRYRSRDAEDIFSLVCVRTIQNIHTVQNPDAFPGWIKQTTVRICINCLREEASRQERTESLTYLTDVATGDLPPQVAMRAENRRLILEGIDRLKPMDAEVLRLHYLEHTSLLEMAARLDVPMGTVKRRLCMARRRLRDVLLSLDVDADEEVG